MFWQVEQFQPQLYQINIWQTNSGPDSSATLVRIFQWTTPSYFSKLNLFSAKWVFGLKYVSKKLCKFRLAGNYRLIQTTLKSHWFNSDTITPDSSSSLASRTVPEFWRFLQTQNRERQKGLGKKEGLGKKSCDFLVSQGVCLLFLMGEFKYDLEEFHQKLVQTKLVPVPETNAAGKKAHHNSIPQHPSTVQQPADEPAGTRNDPFKGIKISMEPVILF